MYAAYSINLGVGGGGGGVGCVCVCVSVIFGREAGHKVRSRKCLTSSLHGLPELITQTLIMCSFCWESLIFKGIILYPFQRWGNEAWRGFTTCPRPHMKVGSSNTPLQTFNHSIEVTFAPHKVQCHKYSQYERIGFQTLLKIFWNSLTCGMLFSASRGFYLLRSCFSTSEILNRIC